MKRTPYKITHKGETVATKYAWNSAIAAIRAHMRKQMRGVTATRHIEPSLITNGQTMAGVITWTDCDGNQYIYEVNTRSYRN